MATYNEVLSQAQSLTPDEQEHLLKDLAALIHQRATNKTQNSSQELPRQSLDRWRGFLPKRVDALEFQLQLRKEWDD